MTRVLAASFALMTVLGGVAQVPPSPPEQPIDGPGGSSYIHAALTTTRLGTGADEVYLFESAEPKPERAPVVVFCHGWGGMDPVYYGSWITHIVRRGFTVIFPRYQADLRTPVSEFTSHALQSTSRALEELRMPGHVAADERGLAFVGHSMGGLVAANLAVLAAQGRLPQPLALMSVEPGKTWPAPSPIAFELEELTKLPSSLLLVTLAGEDDELVRDVDARKIYSGATGVPLTNKDYVRMFSDTHGVPALVADHRAPTAPGGLIAPADDRARVIGSNRALPARAPTLWPAAEEIDRGEMVVDALDYYGPWKLFDGLADAVFRGTHREYALGDTPEQRFMGYWSDRVPVRELIVGSW